MEIELENKTFPCLSVKVKTRSDQRITLEDKFESLILEKYQIQPLIDFLTEVIKENGN